MSISGHLFSRSILLHCPWCRDTLLSSSSLYSYFWRDNAQLFLRLIDQTWKAQKNPLNIKPPGSNWDFIKSAQITEDCSTLVQLRSFSHTRICTHGSQINLLICHTRHTQEREAVLSSRLNCSLKPPFFPQEAKYTCKSPSSGLLTLKYVVKEMFKEPRPTKTATEDFTTIAECFLFQNIQKACSSSPLPPILNWTLMYFAVWDPGIRGITFTYSGSEPRENSCTWFYAACLFLLPPLGI